MKLKFNFYTLFFIALSLMFSNSVCMVQIDKKYIKTEVGKTWLTVPENNNAVLIKLDTGAESPAINPQNPEDFNFKYIDNDGTPLPKGLYYWNVDLFNGCCRGLIDQKQTKMAFPDKDKAGYFYVRRNQRSYFDSTGKFAHSSQSLWGIKAAAGAHSAGGAALKTCQHGNPNHLLRSQIFEYLFGQSEGQFFQANQPNFENAFTKKGDGYVIKNPRTNKEFACGKIELKRLSELETALKTVSKPTNTQPSFNVIFYETSNPKIFNGARKFRRFADVGALQGRDENKDTVFQLASRPNGLEGAREYRGKDFTDITGSHAVQGEEASISAAPGGIFRMFGDVPDMYIKSGKNLGMNFLKYINNFGDKVDANGNVAFTPQILHDLNQSGNWWKDLLICFHENIQVITGLSCAHRKGDDRSNNANDCGVFVEDSTEAIHQVPVCALHLNDTIVADSHVAAFSQNLLKAFYRGTIIASILHGKNKIFLTAVGAGAFKNKPEWVIEAIAACEDLIKTYGLNVYFVFMGFSQPGESDLPVEYQNILSLVKDVGGNILKLRFNNTEKAILMRYDADKKLTEKIFNTPDELEPIFKTFLTMPRAHINGLSDLPHVAAFALDIGQPALYTQLGELKKNLVVLKNKLASLSGKLGLLRDKLALSQPGPKLATPTPGPKPFNPPVTPKPVVQPKQEDIAALVETIFAAAKVNVGDVPCASAFLDENAETKYTDKNKTQSIVHLNSIKNDLFDQWERESHAGDYTLKECLDRVSNTSDVNMVQNMLANEVLHKDYYVFYHAYGDIFLTILHEFYQLLYSWGTLQRDQPLALRFLDTPINVQKAMSDFRELLKTVDCVGGRDREWCSFKNPITNAIEKDQCLDQIPYFKERLLSVNIALFGNRLKSKESTYVYFSAGRSISSMSSEDATRIISEILDRINIKDQKFGDKIKEFIETYKDKFIRRAPWNKIWNRDDPYVILNGKEFLKKEREDEHKEGIILQIFVKKDIIDQAAFWALDGGYNIDVNYTTSNEKNTYSGKQIGLADLSQIKPYMDNISVLLNDYLNDTLKLGNRIGAYRHNIHLDKYYLSLDTLQARIWLESPHLYNPEKTKIIRYSQVNKSIFDNLHKDIAGVFDDLIKEFIKQKIADSKLANPQMTSVKLPKAFQNLNKFIDARIADLKAKGKLVMGNVGRIDSGNVAMA